MLLQKIRRLWKRLRKCNSFSKKSVESFTVAVRVSPWLFSSRLGLPWSTQAFLLLLRSLHDLFRFSLGLRCWNGSTWVWKLQQICWFLFLYKESFIHFRNASLTHASSFSPSHSPCTFLLPLTFSPFFLFLPLHLFFYFKL